MFDEATVYLEKASSQIRRVFSTHVFIMEVWNFIRTGRITRYECRKRLRGLAISRTNKTRISISPAARSIDRDKLFYPNFSLSLISFILAAASLYLLYIEIMFKHR